MMRKRRLRLILFFLFVVGLSVLLYPIISSNWNLRRQSGAVASYEETVQGMSKVDYDEMLGYADRYNKELSNIDLPFRNYDMVAGYESILDVSGTGIMGYISIDKIGVELPIYHGTSEGVLQVAAGHLQGSSLPVGGVGTHSVISAHSGLPDAELFSNLDQLKEGDTFKITILNRTLTYQVDQILIVEPQKMDALYVDEKYDYCTLMTCTPAGVNSHRLLVRGVRVDDGARGLSVLADAYQVSTDVVTVVIAILILLLVVLGYLPVHFLRRRKVAIGGDE